MQSVLVPAQNASWRKVVGLHAVAATAAYAHIFSEPFPWDEAAERWRTYNGQLLLALLDGLEVGFAAWSENVLDALYVLPDLAGRGIGSQLHDALPRSVNSLWVLVDNARGRAFYAARGWSDTGRVRPAYESVYEIEYQRQVPRARMTDRMKP